MRVAVEPLTQWPEGYDRREPSERKRGKFRTQDGSSLLKKTIRQLDHELLMIDARNIVLQVEVSGDEVRKRDGLPYQRADVEPGVVLTFETDTGVQTYPADLYDLWVHNLRAIFYTLHDLRRISRHGVGTGSEQYHGFTALPAAGETTTTMSAVDAAHELARMIPGIDAEDLLEDPEAVTQAFRTKARWSHPDTGGDPQKWLRILDARKVLFRHHGMPV